MTIARRALHHDFMHSLRIPLSAPYVKGGWGTTLFAVAAYFGWLVAWYWPTVASTVWFWYRYETYAHGFIIFPISAWLVWRDRARLAGMVPTPTTSWMPVIALVAGAALWLAGDLTDVLPARQFAFIALFVAGVWILVGDAIFRRIVFPLGFLFFAVPVGEVFTPTLIEWTADFTVASLQLSGVPVLREGMTFRIPTGAWSVVEACSGIRYLIASSMIGVLYAYLSYRSLGRRLAFVAASIVVPIVANWVRAYMIVMIGHLSNNRLAVGVDHILYGWVFFGIVMLLLYWVGSFWREDQEQPVPATEGQAGARASSGASVNTLTSLAVAFAIAAAPPLVVQWTHWRDRIDAPGEFRAPLLGAWTPDSRPLVAWKPRFSTPRASLASTYVRGSDHAGLYVAMYYAEDAHSKLVSSTNRLVQTYDPGAHVINDGLRIIPMSSGPFKVEESLLRVPEGRLLVHRWYWIDGFATTSDIRAKLLQARARLLGRGDAGAIIVTYVRVPEDAKPDPRALDDLTREAAVALPGSLSEWLRGGDPQ